MKAPEPKKANKSGKAVIIIMAAVIVILLGAIGALAYNVQKQKAKSTTTATPARPSAAPRASATANPNRVVDAGVTWKTPEKLSDLGLFIKSGNNDGPGGGYVGTTYYEVATVNDGSTIIDAYVKVSGMGEWYSLYRFVEKAGQYQLIEKNSAKIEAGESFALVDDSSKLIKNSTKVFKSILPDEKITHQTTVLVQKPDDSGNATFVDNTNAGQKVGETKWGDLFLTGPKSVDDSSGSVGIAQYYVKLNDSSKMLYLPKPVFLRDDGTFDLEFTTDTEKANTYKYDMMSSGGCGLGGGSFPIALDGESLQDEQLLGSASGSAKVYYLGGSDNALANYTFDLYKKDGNGQNVSRDEFFSHYSLVIWKDNYGSSIIYLNKDYAPQVECAKPVVYLYPTKKTDVSVKVGARIKKSEPEYGSGWKVTAYPDGKLILGASSYPYLFWDGLGYGPYPEITQGTVVARDQAKSTIENQLALIGLNQKEIADFEEFWLPKMPSAPYVRLTWLTNQQMNKLAPLEITPQPDSIIRVFLDFKGLDQPAKIAPQTLPHYERQGFTAVEWGGLLTTEKK